MAQFDVTVVGELNLDLILYGLPDELEPEKELLAKDLLAKDLTGVLGTIDKDEGNIKSIAPRGLA